MGMGGTYQAQAQGYSNTIGRQSVNSRAPQRMNQAPASLTEVPTEFFYEHNFDENGVLFYLGTAGKRRMW